MGIRVRRSAIALAIAFIAAGVQDASAANINVACGDNAALAAAITTANGTAAADTIDVTGVVSGGCTAFTLTTAAVTDTTNGSTGLPIVTQPLTINGNNVTIGRSTAGGTPAFRIMAAANTLTLNDVTLLGGSVTQQGGGLYGLNATLNLNNVDIAYNAAAQGGGLYMAGGTLHADRSLFLQNAASSLGGAAYLINAAGDAKRTTFYINYSYSSTGAVAQAGGSLTYENTTWTGNVAVNNIGALAVYNSAATTGGTATVSYSTFADNGTFANPATTAPGTAIWTGRISGTANSSVQISNSIVADTDSTATATAPPCTAIAGGTITASGANLEHPGSTCPAFSLHADPLLAPLARENGASAPLLAYTHRLKPNSPAIDAAPAACASVPTDGKSVARPDGEACDIGASEADIPQTTANGPAGPVKTPSITLLSDAASASTFQCKLDNGSYQPCASPYKPAGLTDGSHTVLVKATSAAGYTDATPASVTFTVDATAPVVHITAPANASRTADPTVDVTFTVDDPAATVSCVIDLVAQSCSSPLTTSALGDGSHTIKVVATDAAGNAGSDQVTVTVDTTAPHTTIAASPQTVIFPTIQFSFSSAAGDLDGFECRLDGDAFTPCTSPVTYNGFAEGDHTFQVRAHDTLGNTEAPQSRGFSYGPDRTPPQVHVTVVKSPTNDTTPQFTFTVDDPTAQVSCSVDDSAPVLCSSPYDTPVLSGDGEHTLKVIAVDESGNSGQDTATVVIDTAAPETVIDSSPQESSDTGSGTITFHSSESGSTFACRIDEGAWSSCQSPKTFTGLPNGMHTAEVRATDAAGNTDASPASASISVGGRTFNVPCGDSAALVAAMTSANTNAPGTADIIELEKCTYTLTSAAAPGANGNNTGLPIVVQPLTIHGNGATIARSTASGTPQFRVLYSYGAPLTVSHATISGGSLAAGQNGAGIVSLNGEITLDGVALYANVAGAGAAIAQAGGTLNVTDSILDFNAAVTAGAAYLINVNGAFRSTTFYGNVATSNTAAVLQTGGTIAYENDTFAANAAGNALGGLVVTNSGADTGTANVTSSTFSDASRYASPADKSPANALATYKSGAGNAVIHVRNTVVTDTDSTATPVSAQCDSATYGGSITFDGGNVSWPSAACGTQADPKLAAIAHDASAPEWVFTNRPIAGSPLIDAAVGACPSTDARGAVRPDGEGCDIGAYETPAPNTTATGPSAPVKKPTVTFSADASPVAFQCRIDSGAWSACTSPYTPAATLSDGEHSIDVRAYDAQFYLDNSPAHVTFTVDNTAPVVQITSAPTVTDSTSADIAFDAGDAATVTCQLDAQAPQPCTSPFYVSDLSEGSHAVKVSGTDVAGNTGTATATWTVDLSPPDTTITAGPGGTIYATSATFQFTATESPATFECRLDSGAWSACTSPRTVTGLTPGQHTFAVRAADRFGHVDPTPATRTFTYQKCNVIRQTIDLLGNPITICL